MKALARGPGADPRAAPATAEGGWLQQVAVGPRAQGPGGFGPGWTAQHTAFPKMSREKDGKGLEVRVGCAEAPLQWQEARSASRAHRSNSFHPTFGA